MFDAINTLLWENVLIYALIGLGVLFTFSTRFVQVRYFVRAFRILASALNEKNQINSFQALMLTLAARIGVGNIVGVAVAVTLGGPGAVFWMWLVGLIGMATSFVECTLAQAYKQSGADGVYRGGPAWYIQYGLGNKTFAAIFSVLLVITFGVGFNSVQTFAISAAFADSFGLPGIATGILIAATLGIIILGGARRLARAAEYMVPFMALAYMGVTIYVIISNYTEVPAALALIFRHAFGLEQVAGGSVAGAMLLGIKRGLFANEAGLGSAPTGAALAAARHPVEQGIVQSFSVFFDTFIICTCSATLVILSSAYQPGTVMDGAVLTQIAMTTHIGEWGRYFVTTCLFFFAFTSIMYNYFLGETGLGHLFKQNKTVTRVFQAAFLAVVLWSSVQDLSTVFAFVDVTMGCIALVNLVAISLLLKPCLQLLKDYDGQIQRGIANPVFDPARFSAIRADPKAWNASTNTAV